MRHLKLTFPATFAPNPQTRFRQIIKILDQVCKQYKKQIPTIAWKPISVTSQELKIILREKSVDENSIVTMTQKGDISVIHADKKQQTFGKRYALHISHNGSSDNISLAIVGSRELYDLLINISQDANLLLSYKALIRSVNNKKTRAITELQLITMPSGNDDNDGGGNDNYMFSVSYKRPFKRTAAEDCDLLKAMQLQLQQLSLTPEIYARNENNNGHIQKITEREFENIFDVKLLQSLSVDKANDNIDSHLKNIHTAYRRLQPYIDGYLAYNEGIKNGSLQYVSQKSLLTFILAQVQKNKNKKKKFLPRLVIVQINDVVGYGLIAGEYIPAGTIIGEYCGEISKVLAPEKDKQQDNTYFAAYAPDAVPGSELFVIDARKSGNSTRFINHSDENSNAIWAHVFDGKKFRLVIAAVKPIAKGKQILLKYKDTYWSSKRSAGSSSHLSNTPYPL